MTLIDLNLLTVFDALDDVRSVTKAAQRLNVTQSAVSHALRRLREAVDDPLFRRVGGVLQPTARAVEMAPGVREGLARLRTALVPAAFDPPTATRTFTVAAGSYFCALLIPRIVARAREAAPGITFRIVPVGGNLLAEMDDGSVDLALGAFDRVPPRLVAEPLFREDLVWIAARANPVCTARLTQDALLRNPHLVIATRRSFDPVDALLAEGPMESLLSDQPGTVDGAPAGSIPAVVYDALTAMAVVAQTDMVALVPRRIALNGQDRLGLSILDIDGGGRGIDMAMVSHGKAATDTGIEWLRAQVADLSR